MKINLANIKKARNLLNKRECVAIPTETVYGIAGNAYSDTACKKIFRLKKRPMNNPLIIHYYDLKKLKNDCDLNADFLKLYKKYCPGPISFILKLKKNSLISKNVTNKNKTLAVRFPKHSLTRKLLSNLKYPLAAPSANPFGYVSPTSAQHVEDQLGDKIPYILDGGPCHIGLESTIVGFDGDDVVVYRLGGTKVEAIEEIVGKVKIQVNESSNPAAPGMLKSHYSPGRKMIIGDISENLKELNPETTGILSFMATYDVPEKNQVVLSPTGDLDEAARNIFSALRKMDQPNIEVILTEFLPQEGLGKAINDRLRRAAV